MHGRLGDGAPSYDDEPVCQRESEYFAGERPAYAHWVFQKTTLGDAIERCHVVPIVTDFHLDLEWYFQR